MRKQRQNLMERWLAIILAFTLLVGLLPPLIVPVHADVNDHIIDIAQDDIKPDGITIDLIDYWITPNRFDQDTNVSGVVEDGINTGHLFKFGSGMGEAASGSEADVEAASINDWTKSSRPKQEIVKPKLGDDGYPVLNYQTETTKGDGESLSYLFNGSEHEGKTAFMNVGGLLQKDSGYYVYSAQNNYAYFDEASELFKVYEKPAVKTGGAWPQNQLGQFFPFNSGSEVFEERNSSLSAKNLSSTDGSLHHYFGLHMKTHFMQPIGGASPDAPDTPITYDFSGDDDVWIFIDDVLIGDLGGIHDMSSIHIDFSTGDVITYKDENLNGSYDGGDSGEEVYEQTTLKALHEAADPDDAAAKKWNGNTYGDNTYHTMSFFYLERGNTDSNLKMRYNLITAPTSTLLKVDQDGTPVPNVEFNLYEVNAEDGGEKSVATGSTDSEGRFTFYEDDGAVLNISDLRQGEYVLRETEPPPGYRGGGDIKLRLIKDAGNEGANLVLSDNAWDSGTYAMAKLRTNAQTAVETKQVLVGYEDPPWWNPWEDPTPIYEDVEYRVIEGANGEKYDLSEGIIFGVVMKGEDVKYSDPKIDEYNMVYGDAINGWNVIEKKGTEGIAQVATEIISSDNSNTDSTIKGIYSFRLNNSNVYYADITNIPGDVNRYAMIDPDNAEYTTVFFYAESLEAIAQGNMSLLNQDVFTRYFAVNIYTPNIQNRLLVQKVDTGGSGQPLAGATFALYHKDDLNVDENGSWTLKDNTVQPALPTVTTEYLHTLPSDSEYKVLGGASLLGIPKGEYYLVETQAPKNYAINPKAVEIIVDDLGVHADAGTADDNVNVALGVGKIVKSMGQFATDDGIDATLHDITAELQVADRYEGADTNWQDTGSSMDLSYSNAAQVLEYGATTSGGPTALVFNEGWARLNITQTDSMPTENGTLKQDLGDEQDAGRFSGSLNNLYSGTVMVSVGDKLVRPANVLLTKHVAGPDASSNNEEFTINLTLGENGLNGGSVDAYQNGSWQPVEFSGNTASLTIKNQETIPLMVTNGIELTVAEADPGSAYTVSYQINNGEKQSAPIMVTASDETQEVIITNSKYALLDGASHLKVTKQFPGGWPDGEVFDFEITGKENAPLPKSAMISISQPDSGITNSKAFGDIVFTEEGEYIYEVREVKGENNMIDYDEHVAQIRVTVESIDNRLTVTKVSYSQDDTLNFVNKQTEFGGPLPETGGPGTTGVTVLGSAIMAASVFGLRKRFRKS